MGEFFRGWRRKIGVVTLLMASVFMAGWMRSLIVADRVQICGKTSVLHLQSNHIGLNVDFVWDLPTENNSGNSSCFWTTIPIESYIKHRQGFDSSNDSFWRSHGFIFVSGHLSTLNPSDQNQMISTTLPYWSIVIPLTLISLWQLLSKPRKATPKRTVELIPEKVA